jgi:hypothetical protein
MPPPNLKVHSLKVSHQLTVTPQGQPAVVKNLSYHVGDHGPFHHQYVDGTGTSDKMKSDIGAQVAELASVHEVEQ